MSTNRLPNLYRGPYDGLAWECIRIVAFMERNLKTTRFANLYAGSQLLVATSFFPCQSNALLGSSSLNAFALFVSINNGLTLAV